VIWFQVSITAWWWCTTRCHRRPSLPVPSFNENPPSFGSVAFTGRL